MPENNFEEKFEVSEEKIQAKIKHLEEKFSFARYELIKECEDEELRFYLYLKLYAINKHSSFPSKETIFKDIQWKSDKIKYWTKRMVEKGRLKYNPGSGRTSSLYDITWYDILNLRGRKNPTGRKNPGAEIGKTLPEQQIIEQKELSKDNCNKDKSLCITLKKLITYFYELIKEKKGFKPKITASDIVLLKAHLKENNENEKEVESLFAWFIQTEKFKDYPTIRTALSSHSVNLYRKKMAAEC